MGLVDEASVVTPRADIGVVEADLHADAFFGVTCIPAEHSEFDYLTLRAKTTLPGVPSTFEGVSGGGLWQITLNMKAGTIISPGEYDFCGVAFWQQPQPANQILIRCHGPRSVFEKAWNAWELPGAHASWPSDYAGVLYKPLDPAGNWRWELAREIDVSGIPVDLNRLK
jgi:hypothetical protein